jgi:hypothetical protein
MNGPTQEFQKMANQYNQLMMDSWSSWTKQTVQSDSFTAASGAFMDWSLATHKMMNDLSGQVMESLDIPKRSDLARISAQVQSVETRLLEQEDTADEIKDLLTTLVQKIETLSSTPAQAPAQTPAKAVAAKVEAPQKATEKIEDSEPKSTASKSKTKTRSKKSKAKKASKKS